MTNKKIKEIVAEAMLRGVFQDDDPNGFRQGWLAEAFQSYGEACKEEEREKIEKIFSLTVGAVSMGVISKEQGYSDLLEQLQALTKDI